MFINTIGDMAMIDEWERVGFKTKEEFDQFVEEFYARFKEKPGKGRRSHSEDGPAANVVRIARQDADDAATRIIIGIATTGPSIY